MNVTSYQDLEVWKCSRRLVKIVYQLTKYFPKEEMFGLTSQVRRAAVSIPSNIAEGYSRHGIKDYVHFISIAIGSLAELETQLLLAQDLEYISDEQTAMIFKDIKQLRMMLYKMRSSLKAKMNPKLMPVA